MVMEKGIRKILKLRNTLFSEKKNPEALVIWKRLKFL